MVNGAAAAAGSTGFALLALKTCGSVGFGHDHPALLATACTPGSDHWSMNFALRDEDQALHDGAEDSK